VTKPRSISILCIGNDLVPLNLRCLHLREQGWNVLSSGSGFEGINQFTRQIVDAVVVDLDDDGTEAALIIGELKRLRPEVPVIMLATDEKLLAPGATQQADAVIIKSQEEHSLSDALKIFLSLPGKTRIS
jgi:CheY-like chemotaxis protein